jgi:hypothetical protein
MKASELIKLLQINIKKHGDLEVIHREEYETDYYNNKIIGMEPMTDKYDTSLKTFFYFKTTYYE